MLRLLLDIHIDPDVARGVAAIAPDCEVFSLRDWQRGEYRAASDATILEAVHREGLTLVTYDVRSVPALLRDWATRGRQHAGAVFIDHKTVAANDVGALARSLAHLFETRGSEDWTNCTTFLEREE